MRSDKAPENTADKAAVAIMEETNKSTQSTQQLLHVRDGRFGLPDLDMPRQVEWFNGGTETYQR
jgi:hypothetical protein